MMYYSWLEDKEWILSLVYLHDIFEQLDKLNLRMQGKDTNIIIFVDALRAFKSKLANWKRKVEIHSYTMFEKLDILLGERPEGMPDHIKNENLEHLSALESELEWYFPETTDEDLNFVRNPLNIQLKSLLMIARTNFWSLSMILLHGKNMKRNFCCNSGSR